MFAVLCLVYSGRCSQEYKLNLFTDVKDYIFVMTSVGRILQLGDCYENVVRRLIWPS